MTHPPSVMNTPPFVIPDSTNTSVAFSHKHTLMYFLQHDLCYMFDIFGYFSYFLSKHWHCLSKPQQTTYPYPYHKLCEPIVFTSLHFNFILEFLNDNLYFEEWHEGQFVPVPNSDNLSDPNKWRGVNLMDIEINIFSSLLCKIFLASSKNMVLNISSYPHLELDAKMEHSR